MPLAALVFLGAFVPVIGAVVAGGIAVLIALVANGPVAALIVLGIIVAIMQLEGCALLRAARNALTPSSTFTP